MEVFHTWFKEKHTLTKVSKGGRSWPLQTACVQADLKRKRHPKWLATSGAQVPVLCYAGPCQDSPLHTGMFPTHLGSRSGICNMDRAWRMGAHARPGVRGRGHLIPCDSPQMENIKTNLPAEKQNEKN